MKPVRNITHVTQPPDESGSRALGALFASVYADLQHVASGLMRHERTGHTLGTTGVLHEAYQRLIRTYADSTHGKTMDHDELRALTAKIMRRVLVDHARSRDARDRADHGYRDTVHGSVNEISVIAGDLETLDSALAALARIDEHKATIVELRFFGGMPMARIASLLGRSLRSVERDWAFARAWLSVNINGDGSDAR